MFRLVQKDDWVHVQKDEWGRVQKHERSHVQKEGCISDSKLINLLYFSWKYKKWWITFTKKYWIYYIFIINRQNYGLFLEIFDYFYKKDEFSIFLS